MINYDIIFRCPRACATLNISLATIAAVVGIASTAVSVGESLSNDGSGSGSSAPANKSGAATQQSMFGPTAPNSSSATTQGGSSIPTQQPLQLHQSDAAQSYDPQASMKQWMIRLSGTGEAQNAS